MLKNYFSFLWNQGINVQSEFHEKVLGGLLGFCIGDALGVPLEFKPRNEVLGVSTMLGYGTHNQPPGSWSDDSSLTFCLVENLIGGYDVEDLKQKFCDWYYYGFWTHNQQLPFDIGQSTFKSLSRIKAGISKGEPGQSDEKSNGNGSLMRVLPLAYYLRHFQDNDKYKIIEEVSGITHAHIRSKIACSIYVEMAIQLIQGEDAKESYEKMKKNILSFYSKEGYKEELVHFHRILQEDIALFPMEDIKSSGYVIDTLEACLWSFLNSSDYPNAVLRAIRLGDDTDTIGALTGGLAGIYFGVKNIPRKWIKQIARKQDIIQLADRYYQSLIQK